MKLTQKETDLLLDTAELAEGIKEQIEALEHAGRMGYDVDENVVWELKNQSAQISAVLYNIHHGIYRQEVRS